VTASRHDDFAEFAWRRPAPIARRAAMAAYSWQSPGVAYFSSIAAALPFILAAALAPALLSLTPTVDMLAPIAEARAALSGEAPLQAASAPFYLMTILAGDFFADSPGRILLVAKAISAIIVTFPMAYFVVSRLPMLAGVTLTGALAGFVAAPFAGPAEFALALFLVCAFSFVAGCADRSAGRARFEGLLAGFVLYALWLLNPVFSLAGFVALSFCPFLSGPNGLSRYASSLAVFALCAGLCELALPGINVARAAAASGTLSMGIEFADGGNGFGLSGVAVSALLVLLMTAIFGGGEHWRGIAIAMALGIVAFVAARLTGANALPAFVFASTIAAFSVASPFYDGLFRNHDRASVAVALAAAALPVFWIIAMFIQSAGQFSLQNQTAKLAPQNIRTELALVQPGGPTIAQWIEEGRFSTPEAREFLALAPVDQSAMLLEAASRAKVITASGIDVAILAGADAACVIAEHRACHANSNRAAENASVVFVPRLDFGPAADHARGSAEALLYTEFRKVEETPFWEIWVRRGASLPGGLLGGVSRVRAGADPLSIRD